MWLCQVEEAALSTPEAVVASRTDWQTALMPNSDDQRQHHPRQSIIFSFSISSLSSILHRAHNITPARHVGNCRVASFQFSGILSRWATGNGVITLTLLAMTSQTMMQITRAEIIAVTLLIHQSLWPFRPLLWIWYQAVSLMLERYNQRPAVKPRYYCNGRCTDGYHHDQSWVKRHAP